MTLTRLKELMHCAHSIWTPAIRAVQPRDFRKTVEHGYVRTWARIEAAGTPLILLAKRPKK